MKKVEFVKLKSELDGYGPFKGSVYTFRGVEDIIKERVENGWEYLGYIPVQTRATGDIETMSLIFQKDE
mgnify:CR=1 FL=1